MASTAIGQGEKNSLRFGFRNETWESPNPNRQLYQLTYGRIMNGHELFFRTNLMSWQDRFGAQYTLDFYPKFNEHSYGYASVAYSNFLLFPTIKLAAEYFKVFGTWETSLGLRYSKANDNDIVGFTGTLGKYYGNWFTYFRPIFSIVDGKFADGYLISTRRYFATKNQFAEGLFYWGNDTGEIADISTLNLGLKYFLIRFSYQHELKNKLVLSLGLDYSGYYNINTEKYVKVFSADFTIMKRF